MTTYREAGVDLIRSDSIKNKIAKLVHSTFTENVISKGVEFGGVYQIPNSSLSLVSSIDGVGTKLKIAFLVHKHDTVGQDLVNHCVNDICVMGATPAFFLDYFASGELEENTIINVIKGIVQACKQHSIALIGGETAQVPGIYRGNEYDLAGTIIGFLEKSKLLPKGDINPGDIIIGFRSNGLHTNGYSLVRKIVFEQNKWTVDTYQKELNCTWGEELLRIHKSYYDLINNMIKNNLTKALAHITGGGIPGNLTRILPSSTLAHIDTHKIPPLPIFNVLKESGKVTVTEMYNVFNMGVGLISISSLDSAEVILREFPKESFLLGEIFKDSGEKKVSLSF